MSVQIKQRRCKWRSVPASERKLITIALGERDGWQCHYCTKTLVPPGCLHIVGTALGNGNYTLPENLSLAVVEHKVAQSRGGSNELNNLLLACDVCNSRKGAKDYYEFLMLLEAEEVAA